MYLARVLPVPVGDEVVELSLDDLPGDIEDYVQVLREERCSAPFWLKLASECGARRRLLDCETVLQSAIQTLTSVPPPGSGGQYRSQQAVADEVAPFNAMLATLQLGKARQRPTMIIRDAKFQALPSSVPDVEDRTRAIHAATLHANAAAVPSLSAKSTSGRQQQTSLRTGTLLARGIFLTATGKTDEALKIFDAILQSQTRNPVALLGKACTLLRKKSYAAALKLYQDALAVSIAQSALAAKESAIVGPDGELVESQASKWLGPDPRVGIGLCLHGLGRHNDAQRAWARATAVNPTNAAPHLLLGLSKMNTAKQLVGLDLSLIALYDGSEAVARATLYKEAVMHIHAAWKHDKTNAMAAAALAEHYCVRAHEGSLIDKHQAQRDFERALKLSEHAIQYADNLPTIVQARLTFARTAHLFSYLDETSASTVELRALAQRYYTRVAEDLQRGSSSVDASTVGTNLVMAVLGLAQLQASRSELLGAINTTEIILARPASMASSCLELSLFAAALRSQSHPGATPSERAADRRRARILLERTMRSIDACAKLSSREDDLDSSLRNVEDLVGYEDGSILESTEAAEVALARTALAKENLGIEAVKEIAALCDDVLNHVQLADLFRDSTTGTPDFVRAADALLSAIKALRRRGEDLDQGEVRSKTLLSSKLLEREAFAFRLRANLGAILTIRGIEQASDKPIYLPCAIAQLQKSLDLAITASTSDDLDAEKMLAKFNLGRALEAAESWEDAKIAYEEVLAYHPEYVDAKVCLALLVVSQPEAKGNPEATQFGSALLKEGLASDPTNLDVRSAYVCFLAGDLPGSPNPPQWDVIKETIAQLFTGETNNAAKMFGGNAEARNVGAEARKDAYILTALSWAYYNLGHSVPPGPDAKKEKLRSLLRCCDLLDKALSEDSNCAFAVQGLAILAAEGTLVDLGSPNGVANSGELDAMRKQGADDAIGMLTKLREVTDDASVHICLGHANMVREDYKRALRSYELAARKSTTNEEDIAEQYLETPKPSLCQYLARASFHLGAQTKSYAMLKSSIAYYEMALLQLQKRASSGAVAESKFVRYNIAVTRHKILQMLFDLPMEERKLNTMKEAVEGIEPSEETFRTLLSDAQAGKLSYVTAEIVEQRLLYSESSLRRQAARHIEEQTAYEEAIRIEREAIAERKRERQEALERELMEREEERRQRLAEIEEERKKVIEETRMWEYAAPPEDEKRGRDSKKNGTVRGEKKTKKQKKRRMDEGGSEIESSEDERGTVHSSDDDDMVVSDSAAVEQGDISEEDVLGKPVDSGDEETPAAADGKTRNGGRTVRQAAQEKLKKTRAAAATSRKKQEKRSSQASDGDDDDRPAKKPKKSKLRRVKEDDLIESEEEV